MMPTIKLNRQLNAPLVGGLGFPFKVTDMALDPEDRILYCFGFGTRRGSEERDYKLFIVSAEEQASKASEPAEFCFVDGLEVLDLTEGGHRLCYTRDLQWRERLTLPSNLRNRPYVEVYSVAGRSSSRIDLIRII